MKYKVGDKFKLGNQTITVIRTGANETYFIKIGCCQQTTCTDFYLDKLERYEKTKGHS